MRHFFIILSLVCLTSACANLPAPGGHAFFDSNGNAYDSDTAGKRLQREFGLIESPSMIFVVSKSGNDQRLEEQIQILNSLNPEDFSYLLITGRSGDVDKSAYYMEESDIQRLLSGSLFKIEILDGLGDLNISSDQVIKKELVQQFLSNH